MFPCSAHPLSSFCYDSLSRFFHLILMGAESWAVSPPYCVMWVVRLYISTLPAQQFDQRAKNEPRSTARKAHCAASSLSVWMSLWMTAQLITQLSVSPRHLNCSRGDHWSQQKCNFWKCSACERLHSVFQSHKKSVNHRQFFSLFWVIWVSNVLLFDI